MVIEREIRKLVLDNGRIPFDEWYRTLLDKKMRASVGIRLNRVRLGNFGDSKPVGSGVSELRIDLGPGLRIYYGAHSGRIVLLLGGGDKRTQQRDINNAIAWWKQWKASKDL